MNLNRLRKIFWTTAVAMVFAAVLFTVLICFWPYQREIPAKLDNVAAAVKQPSETKPTIELSAFAHVWDIQLQKPLLKQQPSNNRQTVTAQSVAFNVKLVGIAIEKEYAKAMFATSQGEIELKAVGESINQAEVVEIRKNRVTVKRGSRLIELQIDKNKR